MTDQTELDYLVKIRGYKRENPTRRCNGKGTQITSLVEEQQNKYMQQLIWIQTEPDKLNDDILELCIKLNWSNELINTKQAECASYDAKVLEVLSQLKNTKRNSVSGIKNVPMQRSK